MAFLADEVQCVLRDNRKSFRDPYLTFNVCWLCFNSDANIGLFRTLLSEQPIFATSLLAAVARARSARPQTQHDKVLRTLREVGGSNRSYREVARKLRVSLVGVEAVASRERSRQIEKLAEWNLTLISERDGVSRIGVHGDVATISAIEKRHKLGLPIRIG